MEDNVKKRRKTLVIAIILIVAIAIILSIQHDVDVEIEGEGTVEPTHASVHLFGTAQFKIIPAEGYRVSQVLVDGEPKDIENGVLKLTNILSDHKVRVIFSPAGTYQLDVSIEGNGSVFPGSGQYSQGESVVLDITPDEGYVISDVSVDGKSVGSTNRPLVTMDSDHSVKVIFREQTESDPVVDVSVDVKVGLTTGAYYGTISPSGLVRVAYGGSLTVTIALNEGYVLSSVVVDGKEMGTSSIVTVTNITKDVSIDITVLSTVVKTYTIISSSTSGGSISPSGSISVVEGGSQTFTITAYSGYHLSSLMVDGTSISYSGSTYTFTNVTSDHTISAVFTADPTPGPMPVKTLTRIVIDPSAEVPGYCYIGDSIQGTVRIIAYYSDGSTEQQTGTCSPTTWDSPGTKTVTVSYGGKTCSFNIVVPELSSIEITQEPSVKTFAKGDTISLDGMKITARYTDPQYDRAVGTYTYSPDSFSAVGEQSVTIKYKEGSTTKTTSLEVIIVDKDGFTATVIEYSGKKVVNGTVVAFDRIMDTRLSGFTFDMGNTSPGIVQTITVKVKNNTGMAQEVCIYVSDLDGDDILAQQIGLSSGDSQSTVKDAASRGEFVILGEIADGAEKTFTLTIEFIEGPDNNLAMGKSLSFKLGVFAGQNTEGS